MHTRVLGNPRFNPTSLSDHCMIAAELQAVPAGAKPRNLVHLRDDSGKVVLRVDWHPGMTAHDVLEAARALSFFAQAPMPRPTHLMTASDKVLNGRTLIDADGTYSVVR